MHDFMVALGWKCRGPIQHMRSTCWEYPKTGRIYRLPNQVRDETRVKQEVVLLSV